MKLNELSDIDGSRKARRRVGRGIGSGKGTTAGRGDKGQKSRSGVALGGFEGGQMPLFRRLPKRGFHNPFRKHFEVVNLDRLQAAVDAGKLDAKKTVDRATLVAAGLVRDNNNGVRLLGRGEIKAKLTIDVDGASKAGIAAVEKAGGTVNLAPVKPKPETRGRAKVRAEKEAKAKAKAETAE
ncbi:MAG: 50S ribosomal protein L15 [Pseudomonadota bacterium]|nr:50S ribosomal protein L15 [Pseudomonadota bacterium]